MSRRTTMTGDLRNRPSEFGFTLIELIAVVAVIGVLAAIAIPVFLSVQGKAKDASVQSDLVHAKTALIGFSAGHDGDVPSSVAKGGSASWASTTVDLVPYGWTLGATTADLVYSPASGSSWCMLATSSTGAVFRVTPSTAVVRASSCP